MSHVVRRRVADRAAAGIHGARVLISDRKTGRLLADAVTGADGNFTARVDELDTISVRVLDARGELVSRKSLVAPAERVGLEGRRQDGRLRHVSSHGRRSRPGNHEVTLEDGGVSATVAVSVAEPSAGQLKWRERRASMGD